MKSHTYCHKQPPPDYGSVYIKLKLSAAVLKGIAALFDSTGKRVLPVISILFYRIIILIRMDSVDEPCVFLFNQKTDKPPIPRCRSPPPLLSF